MTVAILIPVLGRPHRVRPLLASIAAATPEPHSVAFICDPDDTDEIDEIDAVLEGQAGHRTARVRMFLHDGGYAAKIRAAVELTSEPLVFAAADDLHFHPGWLKRAAAHIKAGAQVVGVNDLLRRRRRGHATHFLIAREYATRPCIDGTPGPMYGGYAHSFVDDELIATATHRGVYAYEPAAVVEHQHWMNRRAPDDETYRKGRVDFDADRALFQARSHLWT